MPKKFVRNLALALLLLWPASAAIAALAVSTIFEVQSAGSDTANGGGFDPGNASMATDAAFTSANTASPVVTSASYTFIARDVGHWFFYKAGTGSTPGWYKIASVSAGAATLTATIGSAVLYETSVPSRLSVAAGCATTASPTGGTWSIDYSQSASAAVSFTDMVIDGATNTKFTSAANPVGKNFVGNIVSVTSGTGFTVQRVQISSVTTTTATCDKSLGTLSSTGGNGGLGGALASQGQVGALQVSSSTGGGFIKSGTYDCSTSNNVSGGRFTDTGGGRWVGYGTTRLDYATRPILRCGANSVTIWNDQVTGMTVDFIEFQANSKTTSRAIFCDNGASDWILNCKFSGFTNNAILIDFSSNHWVHNCEVASCTTAAAVSFVGSTQSLMSGCNIHGNTGGGAQLGANQSCDNIFQGNTGIGLALNGIGAMSVNDTSTANTTDGFDCPSTFGRVINGLSYNNGGWGFNQSTGPNTSNLISCASDAGHSGSYRVSSGFSAFRVSSFITLTADPFTNAAGGDYTLNATAGGGAAVKGLGFPRTLPGLTPTNYPSVGAYTPAPGSSIVTPYRPRPR